jgi:outer membrane protein assembly factor BamA
VNAVRLRAQVRAVLSGAFSGRRACLAVLLAVLSASGAAQSQKPLAQASAEAQKLIQIKVTGSQRFAPEAIAACTGLELGKTITEDDFKQASRRLADIGAFTDVAYTFSYSSAGTKLEFHVTDAQRFVPAHFEDFVWFSESDLRQRIQDHVPLFAGQLPLSGRMADEVSDVLQAMLIEKGVPGHVDYSRVSKSDGPVESINYKVSEVLIRVRKIEFTGAGAEVLPALETAAAKLGNREYSRARLEQFAKTDLLPVFLSRGYLKAAFGEPEPRPVNQSNSAAADIEENPRNRTLIDVVFAAAPGRQYKLKEVTWSDDHEFPADTLQSMLHAPVGAPANMPRLNDDLKAVQELYGSHGFVTATIKADAEFDDAESTVALHLHVNEGAAYHMGELQYRGLDNGLVAKLQAIWKLRPGEIYDSTYLARYLPEAQKLLPPRFDWSVSPHVTANLRDKSVDVDLIYSVRATGQ